MHKIVAALVIGGTTLLAACQADDLRADRDIYPENGNTINMMERSEHLNETTDEDSFGYVRHQRSPVEEGRNYDAPNIDREQLADTISRLIVTVPNIQDAAALVTDEEVLIAYETTVEDKNDRYEVADQVKKTAISVVPRFFHVYVSDDPTTYEDIERFGGVDADSRGIESAIDQTIQEMLNSPQGRKLSDGENENGESIGEINDNIDNDDIHQKREDRTS